MADWEEIKRLAADFQKVQLGSTSQKLSERNCIEIISWLKDKKIIELIFTVDGKEFLTSSQLVQDIKNELYVNGGRINLVELANNIGVDLAHINSHLKDVLRGQKDIRSILGQLLDSSYIQKIAGEINEKLHQQGQINISDLTMQYDLPAEFIQQDIVEKHLGKIIHGTQDSTDPRVFFTESFIARCKSKIRGALTGLTRPTSVNLILSHINLSEKLFFTLFDQVSVYGTLTSRNVGSQYIPNVYARSQNEWVGNFYKQNGYLEFDALSRLGILDHKTFIKKHIANDDLAYLHSCVVSKGILERAEADIDECIASKSFIDMQNNLPSIFSDKDIKLVLDMILTKQRMQQTIYIGNYVISKAFVGNLAQICDESVKANARKSVDSGRYQQHQTELQVCATNRKGGGKFDEVTDERLDKREERRKKAAGGKTGGGTQGRETKTKSTKKTNRKHTDDIEVMYEGSERTKPTLEIITLDEIKVLIERLLEEEGLDDLIVPLAEYLRPQLNDKGFELAAEIYASTVADRTATRRHTHNDIQNTLNVLIGDVRLFEKGLKLLPDDVQSQLVKYLLRTLCTDAVAHILNYLAAEQNLPTATDHFTHEQRINFVNNDLPPEFKKSLLPLLKTVQGQSIDEFMTTIEDVMQTCCSMIIKKIDKKKDRTVVLNHKHQLLEQLNICEDLALVLHLTVLVIFTTATNCMIHASGRHVASLLLFLKQFLTLEELAELTSYHDFVALMLSGGSEAENAKEKLKEKISTVKTIANEFKKPASVSIDKNS